MKSAVLVEEKCQACDGTGHQVLKKPSQPNRRITESPPRATRLREEDPRRNHEYSARVMVTSQF
jgi:hypothetical protein